MPFWKRRDRVRELAKELAAGLTDGSIVPGPPLKREPLLWHRVFTLPDFRVTFVRESPNRDGFLLGDDRGRLLITDMRGEIADGPHQDDASSAPVTGVADGPGMIVETTADRITVRDQFTGDLHRRQARPAGTHGVTVTPDDYFLVPTGRSGLTVLPSAGELSGGFVSHPAFQGEPADVVAAVGVGAPGDTALVCAMREGGIGTRPFNGSQGQFRTASQPGLDVVDVCPAAPGTGSHAAFGVARDGTVLFVRDARAADSVSSVRFSGTTGEARRILSVRGHLCVVTEAGLHVWYGAGSPTTFPTSWITSTLDLHAHDAFACYGRYVMVVLADGSVVRFDMVRAEKDAAEYVAAHPQEVEGSPVRSERPEYREYRTALPGQRPKQIRGEPMTMLAGTSASWTLSPA